MHVIAMTHEIQINYKKCKNVRFEEKSVSTGARLNSLAHPFDASV